MIIAMTRDLVFSSKIKELCKVHSQEARTVRDLANLESALKSAVDLVIFDLNAREVDVFAAIPLALSAKVKTLGFFSHVDTELKSRAVELGVEKVVPRSKFESELVAVLSELQPC